MNILPESENALYALTGLGILKVSGSDAYKLLQGQLSADLDALSPANGAIGSHCNPQGRVISLFYLLQIGTDYYLVMPQSMITTALAALQKYAIFYKAALSDATGTVMIAGSAHGDWPDAAAALTLPKSERKILLFTETKTTNHDFAAWQDIDMLEGLPAIYPETSGHFLPHDLNLPQLNAVSFTKGCFTGQEIIARMHYRGKPKNHLYRGHSPIAVKPGAPLYSESKPAGTVIDCSQTVYNQRYPLVFVTDEATIAYGKLQTEQGHFITIQLSE